MSTRRHLMHRIAFAFIALTLALGSAATRAQDVAPPAPPPPPPPPETKDQRDARMKWWREAKFGMFIHWGLYAVPAGEWNGKKIGGIGEWIFNSAQIPVADYERLAPKFNPVKFDAKQWAKIAKDAGMKYLVITSKHHDGFCMFDSQLTDYTITKATPFKRDPMQELAAACQEQGIVFCFYHSIMDWHHPYYLPRRKWDDRLPVAASYPRYVDYMEGQLKELLTNYGRIGIIWFDGGWEHNAQQHRSAEVVGLIRKLQPGIIINDRIGLPQDYNTPEQTIPATGIKGRDWETCMTLNDTWGYKKDDQHWKSATDVHHKLIDIVSKGGNFLLNVGPTAEGLIPQPSVERLAEVGKWLANNSESVYGTTASVFPKLAWGRCTTRRDGTTTALYLHVFDWPKGGELVVPGLKSAVSKAYLLAVPDTTLAVTARDGDQVVKVPDAASDALDTVVVLQVAGEPDVTPPPAPVLKPDADGRLMLKAKDAAIHGDTAQYEEGNGKDNIGFWTDVQDWVSWDFTLDKAGKFEVEITYASQGSAGAEYMLSIGKQELAGKTKDTGAWNTFTAEKVSTVDLEAGKQTLSVKPKSKPGVGVMNLKSVVLRPAKAEEKAALDGAKDPLIAAATTEIINVEAALDLFEVDNGRFPTTQEGLSPLTVAPAGMNTWRGPYLRRAVREDPWHHPYLYRCPGLHNTKGYDLSSAGPDGKEGTADDITNWITEQK